MRCASRWLVVLRVQDDVQRGSAEKEKEKEGLENEVYWSLLTICRLHRRKGSSPDKQTLFSFNLFPSIHALSSVFVPI